MKPMIRLYLGIALLLAVAGYTAIVVDYNTEYVTNKIAAATKKETDKAAEQAKAETDKLNSKLEILENEAAKIITQKPHNTTDCINVEYLRMLDDLTRKVIGDQITD